MRRAPRRAAAGCMPSPKARRAPPFQRDRDRIIHSTAFRRLQYKTQVFVYARRRPLPHAPDPQSRSGADRAQHRPRAGARRGSGRGAGARARSRPHALRPCRRGGARRRDEAAWRLLAQRPDLARADPARAALCRVRRAQPHLGDARGHGQAQRPARRASGCRTTIADYVNAPRSRARDLAVGRGAGGGARRRHRLQQSRHRRRAARRPVRA